MVFEPRGNSAELKANFGGDFKNIGGKFGDVFGGEFGGNSAAENPAENLVDNSAETFG